MSARPSRRRTATAGAALVAVASLLLSGCGSGGDSSKAVSLHDQLPEAIRQAGMITVGIDPTYPPVESKDGSGRIAGLDPDIAAALGKQLGVKFELKEGSFDDLIENLQKKQYDVVISAMSDTKQRQNGLDDNGNQTSPGVDFVDYFIAGTSIVVQKGNPLKIHGLSDLCGHTIAVQTGTTQFEIVQRQLPACKTLNKPLHVMPFSTDTAALAQVRAGNAVADLTDFPVATLAAKTVAHGTAYDVLPDQLQAGPYGIAVRKSDTQLRDVLAKAVDAIIISGEYDKILSTWSLSAGAAQNAVINGG